MHKDFSEYLIKNEPVFKAWGEYVLSYIMEKSNELKISSDFIQKFEGPRVKELNSALDKIIRKNYINPLEQMTDLVGVRIVVLLSPQLQEIDQIIASNTHWSYTRDRDFEDERNKLPSEFGYQSNHYVITLKDDIEFNSQKIPKGVKCEIQVRTLLQHAFAVTTHDTLYKPNASNIPSRAHRFMASSMALMETADHLMCETMELVNHEASIQKMLYQNLKDIYIKNFGGKDDWLPNEKINLYVIEKLYDLILELNLNGDNIILNLNDLLKRKPFIINNINEALKNEDKSFWKEPFCLLCYLLCHQNARKLYQLWPLAIYTNQMEILYAHLGASFSV